MSPKPISFKMTALGHSRHLTPLLITSGIPPRTDILLPVGISQMCREPVSSDWSAGIGSGAHFELNPLGWDHGLVETNFCRATDLNGLSLLFRTWRNRVVTFGLSDHEKTALYLRAQGLQNYLV